MDKYISRHIRFCIMCLIIFLIIFFSTTLIMLSKYKEVVRVSIDNTTIGYFKSQDDFEDIFLKLKTELSNGYQECNVYLKSEPVFDKCFVDKNIINKQNKFNILRNNIFTEYTSYGLYLNDNEIMVFNDYNNVNEYYNQIKNNTTKINLEIKKIIQKEKINQTDVNRAEIIKKDIVSRYKPIIIKYDVWNYPTISKYISSPFGYRWGGFHTGIDLAGKLNDFIFSYKSGKVIYASWGGDYGNTILIQHNSNLVTRYAHLDKILVKVGQTVESGQKIGLMGTTGFSTGVHLHFEIKINDKCVNPYKYIF